MGQCCHILDYLYTLHSLKWVFEREGDKLTKEILIEYCDKYNTGDLTKVIEPLDFLYDLSLRFLGEDHGYNYQLKADEFEKKRRYKEDIFPYIPKKKNRPKKKKKN